MERREEIEADDMELYVAQIKTPFFVCNTFHSKYSCVELTRATNINELKIVVSIHSIHIFVRVTAALLCTFFSAILARHQGKKVTINGFFLQLAVYIEFCVSEAFSTGLSIPM